uniref:Ig-like domain-containing protein n=1 Tax=Salvator merianae TaxID=96440 RepID=A0A8D0C022_SALMN
MGGGRTGGIKGVGILAVVPAVSSVLPRPRLLSPFLSCLSHARLSVSSFLSFFPSSCKRCVRGGDPLFGLEGGGGAFLLLLLEVRTECRFQNGTQRVQMLDRYFWGRQEYVRFDSQVGKFVALTELGRPDAEYWNREFLQSEKADVDRFCRHNYGIDWPFARDRRVQPIVTITPMDHPTTSQNILLICNVGRFFPPDIEIKWFKNGEEEEGSHVSSTDLIRNGDWTFQTEVMLETQLERGDVYTCQVDHASLKEPVTVQWDPQSDAARSKMWTGIVGCILFLVFVTPGVFLYVKNKKGDDGSGEHPTWLQRCFSSPAAFTVPPALYL